MGPGARRSRRGETTASAAWKIVRSRWVDRTHAQAMRARAEDGPPSSLLSAATAGAATLSPRSALFVSSGDHDREGATTGHAHVSHADPAFKVSSQCLRGG